MSVRYFVYTLMKPVGHYLDPGKFTVVPHVAIVDEFTMTGDDGSFVATIDADWIARCVEHMNERETTTGDLSPGVIGHTIGGALETAQPPVTAFFRNWQQGPFFDTGRTAAFADCWVFNEDVDRVKKFPRRSGEVWVNRHEIDPISFLGATTPCRDLGMMMLSRGGDVVIQRECPNMPNEKPDDTKSESSGNKELMSKLDAVLAAITGLADKVGGPAAPKGDAKPDAPAADGQSGDISDDELEQMLKEMDGGKGEPAPDESRKAEPKPEKQGTDEDTRVKMQRELDDLRTQVVGGQVKDALYKLQRQGFVVDPEDAALVADLVSMPPEVRSRSLERMKLSRKDNAGRTFNVDTAISTATDGEAKRMTRDDVNTVARLAREKGVAFEVMAREKGFTLVR